MNGIPLKVHAVVLAALVVNLWFGGDLLEAWLGHAVRSAAELLLIGTWLIVIVGMRAPLPWRRRDEQDERR